GYRPGSRERRFAALAPQAAVRRNSQTRLRRQADWMDWSLSTVRVNDDSMHSLRARPPDGTARPPFGRGLKVAVAGALALPLLVFASIGGYSRYTADDFCWAGILRSEGFWNAQALWYTGYSPRYAFTFVVNLTELIGPPIVPLLPAAAIVGLVAAL